MKRTVKIIALLVWLCVLLSGCDAWMGGEYISVTPHEARSEPYADRVIEVTSYTQLRNAITNLVRTGAENGVISISAFKFSSIKSMASCINPNVSFFIIPSSKVICRFTLRFHYISEKHKNIS